MAQFWKSAVCDKIPPIFLEIDALSVYFLDRIRWIPACDRRTDGRTDRHTTTRCILGLVFAGHTGRHGSISAAAILLVFYACTLFDKFNARQTITAFIMEYSLPINYRPTLYIEAYRVMIVWCESLVFRLYTIYVTVRINWREEKNGTVTLEQVHITALTPKYSHFAIA